MKKTRCSGCNSTHTAHTIGYFDYCDTCYHNYQHEEDLIDRDIEEDDNLTYDVVFNDDYDSNNKGFKYSLEDARGYIDSYNGTNESYFEDYKGGTVSIVCNETEETIYEEGIR